MTTSIALGRPTPPGVNEEELGNALAAFAEAIGAEKVSTDDEALAPFQDPYQVPGESTLVPSALVAPASVEDVLAVVRLANEYKVPLWPISRGKNYGYGGAAPRGATALRATPRAR